MSIGFFIVGLIAIACSFLIGLYCGADSVCERLGITLEDVVKKRVSVKKKCSSAKCFIPKDCCRSCRGEFIGGRSYGDGLCCFCHDGMIPCHKDHLIARCKERGYTLDEVMPCVHSQYGDEWIVNVNHPSYPIKPK